MGGNKTLSDKLAEKRKLFEEALNNPAYTERQYMVLKNAIDSIDYVHSVYAGKVLLPALTEDSDSDWGMVYEWLGGSYHNIRMAEDLLKGKLYSSEDVELLSRYTAKTEQENTLLKEMILSYEKMKGLYEKTEQKYERMVAIQDETISELQSQVDDYEQMVRSLEEKIAILTGNQH